MKNYIIGNKFKIYGYSYISKKRYVNKDEFIEILKSKIKSINGNIKTFKNALEDINKGIPITVGDAYFEFQIKIIKTEK